MGSNFKQGFYEPIFPEKWILPKTSITRGSKIRYMSSFELKCFKFLDLQNGITKISSEPFGIKYISPKDNRIHKYYPDLLVKTINDKKFLVEIKPYEQTIPPKQPKRMTKKAQENYIYAFTTYEVNKAKWEAAKAFCQQYGLEFKIITEKELQI